MLRLRRHAASLVAASALAGGLAGCGGTDAPAVAPLSDAALDAALATTPAERLSPEERRLERAANQVWPGGEDPVATLTSELAKLRGTPVVVNLWGEWCGPCKTELPLFQRATLGLRGQVAFLGVATTTTRGKTERYLADEVALPYPSILDADGTVNATTGVEGIPKTLFYDRAGRRVVHSGTYKTLADLQADIRRYALG